jgi:hypothetical protein
MSLGSAAKGLQNQGFPGFSRDFTEKCLISVSGRFADTAIRRRVSPTRRFPYTAFRNEHNEK